MIIFDPSVDLLPSNTYSTAAERTVYRLQPKLIKQKEAIENAAYETARAHFSESFTLILYDVTRLYFD